MSTMPRHPSDASQRSEFDRQVATLLRTGYPALAGLTEHAFLRQIAPLKELLPALPAGGEATHTAFVIVVSQALVPRDRAMPLVELAGKRGFTSMEPDDLAGFAAPPGVAVPLGAAYLVADIDTGRDSLNVTPDAALEAIVRRRRSPLTIDEGIALVTHYPDLLKRMNCFSLLGSRRDDRRVPALWISAGSPRLGWCWAGNPHTWLGSASCGARLEPAVAGADAPAQAAARA